jgi:hypothetical protein
MLGTLKIDCKMGNFTMRVSNVVRAAVIILPLVGLGAGGAMAEEWQRGEFSYDKAPHKFGPLCEYRIRAAGGAPLALFGGNKEVRKAEARSIKDWEGEASHLFGPRYGSWARAAGKEVHCEIKGLRFECFAAANPCRER